MERLIFWMVWHEDGDSPRYRHPTKDAALREAERLAATCPGEVFFVLKATAGVVADSPKITKINMVLDPVPF